MKEKEKKIILISAVFLTGFIFLFIIFSIYFSFGFLTGNVVKTNILHESRGTEEQNGSISYDDSAFVPLGSISDDSINRSGRNSSSPRSAGGRSRAQEASNDNLRQEKNSDNPAISLISPNFRTVSRDGQVDFRFSLSQFNFSFCDFYFDGNLSSVLDVRNVSEGIFHLENISSGDHSWNVVCRGENVSEVESDVRRLRLFSTNKYSGRTTDLSSVENIERVVNFTLENSAHGSIVFDRPVNLSRGINFDDFVRIENNLISIDSERVPELNVSATLTFYGLEIEHPVIFRDGEICTDCQIVDSGEGISFRVEHFSTYTVSGNSALRLFDSTDSTTRYISDQVTFFANYTNLTNFQSINGTSAYCNITFPDGFAGNMTFNSTSRMYEYNRSFSSVGTYLFYVSCFGEGLGFSNLNSNDTYSILSSGSSGSVNGALVNEIWSETASSASAGNNSAIAGNITEIAINGISTTQSWQGYVGNVSGTIQLADASGDVLYNWTTAEPNGEIYASTSNSISWTNIQCFNFTASGTYGDESGNGGSTNLNGTNLDLLEASFGINSGDVDGVDETFDLIGSGTHDQFYTANLQFSEGECPSTRVYDSSGTGVGNNFEEVLLYEPLSSSVVFTSIIEKNVLNGYDGADRDFEMLVLENGHNGNIESTPYYFFVELS